MRCVYMRQPTVQLARCRPALLSAVMWQAASGCLCVCYTTLQPNRQQGCGDMGLSREAQFSHGSCAGAGFGVFGWCKCCRLGAAGAGQRDMRCWGPG